MGRTLKEFRLDCRQELGEAVASAPTLFTNDDQLNRWIKQAVRTISRIRPQYLTTTITPAANTVRYAAPVGLIRLDRVAWIPASSIRSERVFDAVFEPHKNEIHLLHLGRHIPLPTGEVLTVEYTAQHTQPEQAVASSIPDRYEDAVLYYVSAVGLGWMARKLASGNRGVLIFTRGRYKEEGDKIVAALHEDAKEAIMQAREILNADEPAISETAGITFMSITPASPGTTEI